MRSRVTKEEKMRKRVIKKRGTKKQIRTVQNKTKQNNTEQKKHTRGRMTRRVQKEKNGAPWGGVHKGTEGETRDRGRTLRGTPEGTGGASAIQQHPADEERSS